MALKDLFRKYDPAAQIYLTVVDTPEAELPPDQLRLVLGLQHLLMHGAHAIKSLLE